MDKVRGFLTQKHQMAKLLAPLLLAALFLLSFGRVWAQAGQQTGSASWRDLDPPGWIMSTPIQAHAQVTVPTGLDPSSIGYAFSTDDRATWSTWFTANLTIGMPLTNTALISVTQLALPDGAGNWVRFRVRESGGQEDVSPAFNRPVDTAPPQIAMTFPQAHGIYTAVTAIVGNASDATSGLVGVKLSLQDDQGQFWNGSGWQNGAAWLDAEGTTNWRVTTLPAWRDQVVYTATARSVDAAGWTATTAPVAFQLDRTAPGAPQNVSVTPGGWQNKAVFTATWDNPADVSGIAGVWYRWGAPPASPNDGTFVPGDAIHSLALTPLQEGATSFYLWLQDGSGNIGWQNPANGVVHYDHTAPGAPVALHAAPAGWQNVNSFTLTWQNPVDISGISGAWYRFNGEPIAVNDGTFVPGDGLQQISGLQMPGDGVYDVYLWLVDGAGNSDPNTRNVKQGAFSFDGTPPTTQLQLVGQVGAHGWYTSPVQVNVTAEDATSGVQKRYYRLGQGSWQPGHTIELTQDGTFAVSGKAVDYAGNVSTVVSQSVSIDTAPPTLALHYSTQRQANGWFYEPVTVTVTATDDTSGLDKIMYAVDGGAWQQGGTIALSEEGAHTLRVRSIDMAGNYHDSGMVDIPIDLQPPVTTYVVDGLAGNEPWYRSAVSVTLVAKDDGSGVAETFYRVDSGDWQQGRSFALTEDGRHTIWFYSMDNAGRAETSYPTAIWIDKTAPPAPTILFIQPVSWTNRNSFTVTWGTPADLSSVVGAYYKIDQPPTSDHDGTYSNGGHGANGISVPGEGVHDLYLWLQDGAGNADYRQNIRAREVFHFDATAPRSSVTLPPAATTRPETWYNTPITATFTATDTLSGVDHIEYAIDAGPWQKGQQAVIDRDGKHILFYRAVDKAGNVEMANRVTVRLDTTPPILRHAVVSPQGWTTKNVYTVTWQAPLDDSGIAGIWYKVGSAPLSATDGTFFAGDSPTHFSVPREGRFDLYLWLEDNAGNADYRHALRLAQAIWYDGTPPHIAVQLDGERGSNGWFTGPISVSLQARDTVSGLNQVWARIDDGRPFTDTTTFVWKAQGEHTLRIWASDKAGNIQAAEPVSLNIDSSPPMAYLRPLPSYTTQYRPIFGDNVLFHVNWGGVDPAPGSGIASYDVQVREGWRGNWLIWQVGTTETGGDYFGQLGHTYFFRVRAKDRAGHVQPFSANPNGDGYTNLQLVVDGGFETGTFRFWSGNKNGLKRTVRSAPSYHGGNSLVAFLGDPDEYGTNEHPGKVPIGAAEIWQVLRVPDQNQMAHPYLSLWYHMITWDVRYAYSHHRWQDTFEVSILTPDGKELAKPLIDGYRGHNPPVAGVDYGVEHDLGWKHFTYDLTSYAGKMIMVRLANWNRWDNLYNTWTMVDDVQVKDNQIDHHVYLPAVAGKKGKTTVASAPPDHPAALPPGLFGDNER